MINLLYLIKLPLFLDSEQEAGSLTIIYFFFIPYTKFLPDGVLRFQHIIVSYILDQDDTLEM